jgi:precorrin-6B C5,15-methyltransferase / cobalt-precorrin-6B C5,C15-methyltransferase
VAVSWFTSILLGRISSGSKAGIKRVSKHWLSVVGIGDDGLTGLSPIARSLLDQAEIIFGGKRHLAMLPATDSRTQLVWQSPFRESIDQIINHRGQQVCVLASGDPMCYGVGSGLHQALLAQGLMPLMEMTILAAPSAFSLACSRLGWNYSEIETVSLCGRDLHLIQPLLYPGAKILALSADRHTPIQLAQILQEWELGDVQMTILEHLGGSQERMVSNQINDWLNENSNQSIADLHTIALECPGTISGYSRLPGLPDDAYIHDGQLTKREIRAVTLSTLAPCPGQLLWDVGAGNGSISIEWLRSHPRNRAVAIEQHPQRLQNIVVNATKLGVPNLQIISGQAPSVLINLPAPDAIFIGGGLTMPGVFEACWQALKPGGKLVANGVTVETEQLIFQLQQQYGGKLDRIAIQRAESVGKFLGWKALSPVTQWSVAKIVNEVSIITKK